MPGDFDLEDYRLTDEQIRKSNTGRPRVMQDVYIISSSDGTHKIGVSGNVDSRLRQLQTASPNDLWIAGVIPNEGFSLERIMHDRLVGHRLSGEWFEDCDTIHSWLNTLENYGPRLLKSQIINPNLVREGMFAVSLVASHNYEMDENSSVSIKVSSITGHWSFSCKLFYEKQDIGWSYLESRDLLARVMSLSGLRTSHIRDDDNFLGDVFYMFRRQEVKPVKAIIRVGINYDKSSNEICPGCVWSISDPSFDWVPGNEHQDEEDGEY